MLSEKTHCARIGLRLLRLAVVATPLLVAFNNCSSSNLDPLGKIDSVAVQNSLLPSNSPTLAIRSGACIMCHAQIDGNVVSDFGAGPTFVFKSAKYSPSWGNPGGGWSTPSITGNLIVPRTLISKDASGTTYSPAQSMKQIISAFVPLTSDPNMSTPGVRGAILERNQVFIGTPDPVAIQNLSRRSDSVLVYADWDVSVYKIGQQSNISGLISKQATSLGDSGSNYFVNAPGGIRCTGDIVILGGPLALNEANIATDSGGCRIYAEHSVFIKGSVTYNGSSGATPNLQISSSRAILLGIRGAERIEESGDSWAGIRQAPGTDAEKQFNQKIYQDRDLVYDDIEDAGPWQACVGVDGRWIGEYDRYLQTKHWEYIDDASRTPTSEACSGGSDWLFKQNLALKLARTRNVNYNGLYLNAPKIQGRYLGLYQGVVVAEDALFAVQEFKFKRDPTFDTVPILPLFQGRILVISDQ